MDKVLEIKSLTASYTILGTGCIGRDGLLVRSFSSVRFYFPSTGLRNKEALHVGSRNDIFASFLVPHQVYGIKPKVKVH